MISHHLPHYISLLGTRGPRPGPPTPDNTRQPEGSLPLASLDGGYPPKAPAIAGAFYFFNHHHKPLNQPLIPGTIGMQKVTVMPYLAGTDQK